jgi:hypothetical protein
MKHNIELDFKVGDRVMIKEIQRPARVEMVQLDFLGTQYRVAFWDNSKRETVWLYPDEIEGR